MQQVQGLGWKAFVAIGAMILIGIFALAAFLPNILLNSLGPAFQTLFDSIGNSLKTNITDPIYTFVNTNIAQPIVDGFNMIPQAAQAWGDSIWNWSQDVGQIIFDVTVVPFTAWTDSVGNAFEEWWQTYGWW